ncbi:hypothetical protein Tco_1554860 [Tanacetum coccineum]
MKNSKCGNIPMQERLELNKTQGASTPEEVKPLNVESLIIEEVAAGNKASSTQIKGKIYTHVVQRINVKQILEGKLVLVEDDEKPLEKVDYLDNLGTDDEVEPTDNETGSKSYGERKQLTQKELEEKRAENQCIYYDQKYIPSHKCSGQVYSLEVLGDSMNELVDTELEEEVLN